MSIKSVMPSSHLILCHLLLFLPPIPPRIRVFSNESVLRIRWPKVWSTGRGRASAVTPCVVTREPGSGAEWLADPGSQSPPDLRHQGSSHPPPDPPLRPQAALAVHGARTLVAPGLTSSPGAATKWRARAAKKMSPTPPLFSLPEARTRFTVSCGRVGAAPAQRYVLLSSP